jgi:hypothetical protein
LATAGDGSKAQGEVEFYRADDAAGAIVVLAGSVVRTANRKEFVTLENAVFGPTDLGPVTVPVEAVTTGYAWNVPGATVTAGGEQIEGDIAFIKNLNCVDTLAAMNPAIDLELRVRQPAATTGGTDECLNAIGEDRGIARQPGELAEAYRYRIATTPDAVSPDSIRRAANAILAPYDSAVCFREVGTNLLPGFFLDHDAWDLDFDLRAEDRFKLWLDVATFRGFFLLGVPRIHDAEYRGLVYDGSTADTYLMQNAYDTSDSAATNAAYDAYGVMNTGVYLALRDAVLDRVVGGVGFDLYIEEIGCF